SCRSHLPRINIGVVLMPSSLAPRLAAADIMELHQPRCQRDKFGGLPLPGSVCFSRSISRRFTSILLFGLLATTLASCKQEEKVAEPQPRPVRTATVEKSEAGVPVVVTGRIEALDEAALGFRISGRMIERKVNAGDRVEPGQLLGRLEALNELNALRVAKA